MAKKHLDKIPWAEVESSNLNATYYDNKTHSLCVRFNSGGLYAYAAPFEVYVSLVHASSMGSYLHNVVKAYPVTRYETEQAMLDHINS